MVRPYFIVSRRTQIVSSFLPYHSERLTQTSYRVQVYLPLFPSCNDNSGSNDDNNDSKDSDGSNSHRSKVHRHNDGNQCHNNVRSEV